MVNRSMVGQQPRRRYWPCRLMILFVCTPVPSQANLEDYYHVLKRLHKCEDIDVPLQAGVQLLRSNIPPVGGGVLVLRGMGVLGLLQYRHTPIRPQCTEIRTKEGILSVLCVRHFTAGDSQGARTSIVSLSDQSVSAGRDDLVQSTTIVSPSDRPVSAGREGMVQSTTTPSPSDRQVSAGHKDLVQLTTPSPARPPTTARSSRQQQPLR